MEMRSAPTLAGRTLSAAALLLLLAGCGRNDVKVYKVDASDTVTTPAPPVAASGAMPSSMPEGLAVPDNSGLPKLKYTLPAGWKEKPLTQLRVASFEVSENGKTADVSVIPLGGMAGGDAANVNRWRGQVGLPVLEESELKKSAEPAQVGDQPAELYDLAGTAPGNGEAERIIGAILHAGESSWYFKMTGDPVLAGNQKAAFIRFLKTVEFQAPAAPTAMDITPLPASHPPLGDAAVAAGSPDKPTWKVPADWKEGELAQFLVAKYVIQGAGEATAAVNVSVLEGTGGGLLANLNRWRKQLGQASFSEDEAAKLPTVDASGAKAVLTDFTGTDARSGKAARLVGLVLPQNGRTWFYKLMGDPELVGHQKDALIQFVQSAHYPATQ